VVIGTFHNGHENYHRDKPALREQTGRELLDDLEIVAYRPRAPIGDTLNVKKERKELERSGKNLKEVERRERTWKKSKELERRGKK
jgi:hypothetical protein